MIGMSPKLMSKSCRIDKIAKTRIFNTVIAQPRPKSNNIMLINLLYKVVKLIGHWQWWLDHLDQKYSNIFQYFEYS